MKCDKCEKKGDSRDPVTVYMLGAKLVAFLILYSISLILLLNGVWTPGFGSHVVQLLGVFAVSNAVVKLADRIQKKYDQL